MDYINPACGMQATKTFLSLVICQIPHSRFKIYMAAKETSIVPVRYPYRPAFLTFSQKIVIWL